MSDQDIIVVDDADPRAIADIYRAGRILGDDSWLDSAMAMARRKHGR